MLKIPETDAEEKFGIPDQGNSVGTTLLISWSYISAAQSESPRSELTRKRPRQSTETVDLQREPDCPAPHEPLVVRQLPCSLPTV